MKTKQSAEQILANAWIGKKFIGSEFHEPEDILYNQHEQDAMSMKEIVGKIIVGVEIVSVGLDECGVVLKFDGYRDWLFFYENDHITVEG